MTTRRPFTGPLNEDERESLHAAATTLAKVAARLGEEFQAETDEEAKGDLLEQCKRFEQLAIFLDDLSEGLVIATVRHRPADEEF